MRNALAWFVGGFLIIGSAIAAGMDNAGLIKEAEGAMCLALKDCDSAKWRNEAVKVHPTGVRYVCGEVNAKNSYGAYAGFEPFVYFSKEAPSHLAGKVMNEEELGEMELVHPFGAPISNAVPPSQWGLYLMTALCVVTPSAS